MEAQLKKIAPDFDKWTSEHDRLQQELELKRAERDALETKRSRLVQVYPNFRIATSCATVWQHRGTRDKFEGGD